MSALRIRSIASLAFDVVAAMAAWCGAYLLRFSFEIPPPFLESMFDTLPWVVGLQILSFFGLGLYQSIWRYTGANDLYRVAFGVAAALMMISFIMFLTQQPSVPRSVLLIDSLILILAMCAGRLAYRTLKEGVLFASGATPVLVMGAGDATAELLRQLARNTKWRVVGILDDNQNRLGGRIYGAKVLGPLDSMPIHAAAMAVSHAIISMPGVNHSARRRAMNICSDASVTPLIVPSFEEIASGNVTVSQIRQVELDDLLGRDPVRLDADGMRDWLANATVMVTGAGGSIGSELFRQLAHFSPSVLVLVELNEFALYSIAEEAKRKFPNAKIVPTVADVKNEPRMKRILAQWAPAVVFHAAAYKHVPLMEDENAWEAVINNVLGTYVLARAAVDAKVSKFVLISTDKAVNPTNVMGATKRLAELVCRELGVGQTKFISVRFGNVLGSTGSVVPKFREQILAGGPVTVTHPEIQRYFMSIPEASQLVLQAGLMGEGGEIFVLDMGDPVKIVDLAREMIRLSGLSPDDIRIEFTGLRPGEKLFEELLTDDENTQSTPHPKLKIARTTSRLGANEFENLIRWIRGPEPDSAEKIRNGLKVYLPEYSPAQAGQ